MNHLTDKKRAFSGPSAIVLTPFRQDGGVDFDALGAHLDALCGESISGIVVCGSTSEFSQLTPDENMQIMREAADVIAGRKPLICGATAGDYRMSITYLRHMAKLGAQGALVAPPYYLPLGDEDVVAFYRSLSEADTGVPVVVYNIPQFTSAVSANAFEQLLDMDGMQGLKNSGGNINQHMLQLYLRDRNRPEFSILTGSDDSLYANLSVGGDGSFTALADLMPRVIAYIYERFSTDPALALACQMDLQPVLRLASSFTFPSGYKALAEAVGMPMGPYRHAVPAQTAARLEQAKLDMADMVQCIYAKYGIGRD